MRLSIIIPAHNEQATVAEVIKKVVGVDFGNWEKEIITVNDGSTDQTGAILKNLSSHIDGRQYVRILEHQANLGKGAAIRTGLAAASGDYVVIQDADGEYDPKDILNLLSLILNMGQRAAVFGDRGIKSYPERGFHYVIGAKFLTWAFNILNGVWLRDLYTGYRLIPADVFKSLNIKSAGFEFEAEVACKLLKRGVKIVEVPIANYRPRSKQQGKHIRAKDAIIGLWAIIKYRF